MKIVFCLGAVMAATMPGAIVMMKNEITITESKELVFLQRMLTNHVSALESVIDHPVYYDYIEIQQLKEELTVAERILNKFFEIG